MTDRSQEESKDAAFLAQFEMRTLPFGEWHHRAHLKVAYLYLTRFDFETAAHKVRDGIRAYNATNNVPDTPTTGYHETMTIAWLHIIACTLAEYGPGACADEFLDAHPQLSQKKNLRLFYSKELFMSPAAKSQFLPPDLTQFPRKR